VVEADSLGKKKRFDMGCVEMGADLARRFGEKYGFAEGVGAVLEGVGTVRLFGSVGMKGKGTCFKSESLLLVLEEDFVAKQLRL
jgi:hypothetical protein